VWKSVCTNVGWKVTVESSGVEVCLEEKFVWKRSLSGRGVCLNEEFVWKRSLSGKEVCTTHVDRPLLLNRCLTLLCSLLAVIPLTLQPLIILCLLISGNCHPTRRSHSIETSLCYRSLQT
jgi:hypothetical protein